MEGGRKGNEEILRRKEGKLVKKEHMGNRGRKDGRW